MSRCSRPEPFLLLVAALCCSPVLAGQDVEPVWLAVHGGRDAPAEDHLLLRDAAGSLWASGSDLVAWGLAAPAGQPLRLDETDWYALSDQTRLSQKLDAADQALWVEVDPQLRTIQLRGLGAERRAADPEHIEPGGWIDADVQVEQVRGESRLGGLLGANLFNDRGFGSTTALTQDQHVSRLDSTWSVERPDDLQRLDLGDSVVRPGAWGRALRFGGASFGTDFSLQPDLVTFPQPTMRGLAELPSTLDVYVNGLLARQEQIDAGPFVLSDVPVQSGANRTRVVVRDTLGREQVLTQAFYAPAELLRAGLSESRVDAGWLREAYGFKSFAYGSGFAAGSLRRGLNDTLTLEGRAEAASQRQATGLGGAFALPFGGVAEMALAGSHGLPGVGGLVRAGFDWRGQNGLSFGARLRRVSPNWTDLGEHQASGRQQESFNLGLVPARGWSTALTWVHQSARDEPDLELLSLDLSTRVAGDWYLGANFVHTRSAGTLDERASSSSYIGLNLVGRFGGGTLVSEARRAAGRRGTAFEWQRNANDALDDRYRVRAESGDSERWLAEGEWNDERGRLSAAAAHDTEGSGLRVGGATRLAWLGRDRFWTRPGAEGFAVVDAHGLSDVGVMQDQRLAARTDARGLALMPGLRPYQANRFGLVDSDVPIEAQVQALERTVVPGARGGLRIDFPVRATGGQGFRLEMPDGQPLPAGAWVADPVTGLRLPLGSDGLAWWPHGEAPSKVQVRVRGLVCNAPIPPDPSPDLVVRLNCGVAS